jgi:hypothetical protein
MGRLGPSSYLQTILRASMWLTSTNLEFGQSASTSLEHKLSLECSPHQPHPMLDTDYALFGIVSFFVISFFRGSTFSLTVSFFSFPFFFRSHLFIYVSFLWFDFASLASFILQYGKEGQEEERGKTRRCSD